MDFSDASVFEKSFQLIKLSFYHQSGVQSTLPPVLFMYSWICTACSKPLLLMLLKNLNHFLTFFFGGKHRVNMTEIISVFFCNYNMCNLHTVFSALHFTGVTMYVCICLGGQKKKWKMERKVSQWLYSFVKRAARVRTGVNGSCSANPMLFISGLSEITVFTQMYIATVIIVWKLLFVNMSGMWPTYSNYILYTIHNGVFSPLLLWFCINMHNYFRSHFWLCRMENKMMRCCGLTVPDSVHDLGES